jgi:hypothetical protein
MDNGVVDKKFSQEVVYKEAAKLIRSADVWLALGYHLRDARGLVIQDLDGWLLAVEAGEWPVEVSKENQNGHHS